MLRILTVVGICIFFAGCKPPANVASIDLQKEKSAISSLLDEFERSYSARDEAGFMKLLSTSGDMVWFGTDSAEVIKTDAGWKQQLSDDWMLFSAFKFGPRENVSILVDKDGELASVVYECPTEATIGNQISRGLFRFAAALKKENGSWRFAHGLLAVATTGQSSHELVSKIKTHSM